MTYIEFYDRISIDNICGCITNAPERVVLVGGDKKKLMKKAECYKAVFLERGHDIEFVCKGVNKNNLNSIVECLTEIVSEYSDISVDLTGGEDLMLVAMGIVIERFKDRKIPIHRFNVNNNSIYDCDEDGVTIQKDSLTLSVEENIRIYGGDIVYSDEKESGTVRWNMDEEFCRDIEAMWDICRKNPKQWNFYANVMASFEDFRPEASDPSDEICVSIKKYRELLKERNIKEQVAGEMLAAFSRAGFIHYCAISEKFTLVYKNDAVKRCLTKAGLILELFVYNFLSSMRDGDKPFYDDVMNGVFIDWDGKIHFDTDSLVDTENEIDVIAMKGIIPVFISCKNGSHIEKEELYKLKAVAERFGGECAKKVLIATSLEDKNFSDYFKQRAADMDIQIIDDLTELSNADIEKTFRNLWH